MGLSFLKWRETFVVLLDVKGSFAGSEVFWYAVKTSSPSITNARTKRVEEEGGNKFWGSSIPHFLGGKVLDSTLINAFLSGIGSERKGRSEDETSHGLANNWY